MTDEFVDAARRVGAAAADAGLLVPAFRSRPRMFGALRTIRRCRDGTVVLVQLGDRPIKDVTADMIEGVLATNRLSGASATRWRAVLSETLF